MSVDGDDGETIAVVCSRDEHGVETLISECGLRLLRRGPDTYVEAASGRHYRGRAREVPREPPENGHYEVAVHERAGYIELEIRGDFRHSSTVDAAWTRAVAGVRTSPARRRVLAVRGPGRIAGDSDKLDLLRRFFGNLRGDERVALVMSGASGTGGAMLIALAKLHGLNLAVFTERDEASRWLLG